MTTYILIITTFVYALGDPNPRYISHDFAGEYATLNACRTAGFTLQDTVRDNSNARTHIIVDCLGKGE